MPQHQAKFHTLPLTLGYLVAIPFAVFTADAAFLAGTGALAVGALTVGAALVAGADDLAAGLDVVFFMAVMVFNEVN